MKTHVAQAQIKFKKPKPVKKPKILVMPYIAPGMYEVNHFGAITTAQFIADNKIWMHGGYFVMEDGSREVPNFVTVIRKH